MRQTLVKRSVLLFGIALIILAVATGWRVNSEHEATVPDTIERILTDCRLKDPTPSYIRCFKGQEMERLISDVGVKVAMEGIHSLYGEQADIAGIATTSCHDLAHLVGEIAASIGNPLGEIIAECTNACSYGCIHGAVLEAMRKDSHLAGTLPTLCESLPIKDLAPAAHVACEHGIGHGLAALYTLDIKRSFNGCTTLSGYDAQFNCGRGVLMEVIDSPVLEHPRMTFPDDIVAFCRSFTGVLSRACFANAGSRELARSGDAIKAIANCNASPDNRDTCLSYLGQNAYFLLGKDVDRTLAVCQQAEAGLGACVTGVLESVVYVKDANHGMAVCESLSPDDLHECYGKLGELTEFNYGSSERQDSCAKLGSSAVGACMDGSERN